MLADLVGGQRPGTGAGGATPGVMTPALYRVVGRRTETEDVTTLSLSPVVDGPLAFRSGQFNMLTAFGVGEAAISVSSAPNDDGPLRHTVRAVGSVTRALCQAQLGDVIGVRGPFGTHWDVGDGDGPVAPRRSPSGTSRARDGVGDPDGAGDLERARDTEGAGDVVVVAGGIGLAPLRGAVYELVARRARDGGRVFVIVGARAPSQVIFPDDLETWSRSGAEVAVTVDVSEPGWTGHVGLVTSLLGGAGFDPARTTVLVCGPEIMMRFTARSLIDEGVDPNRIWVSLERNMECGVAWCGHCQLGPLLLCRDGPIVPYAGVVSHLLTQRQR